MSRDLDTPPRQRQRPGAQQLGLQVRHLERGRVILEVSGEVDMITAPQLDRVLADLRVADARVVVVDLAGVGFLGSPGLAVLVNAHRALPPGRFLHIVAPGRTVHRAFTVTGLAGQVRLFRTHEDAVAAL
jgi:anti-sigma B factor antagonist